MTTQSVADRGWAWMIVVGVAIINLSVLPVQQCFGLIFEDRFTKLGITAMQTSLILHLNGTITCSLGLISGPMMKRFSFRQVALFGGLTVVFGIFLTAFAVSLPTIIITYCIIIGMGQGIVYPATTLAMNTYFRERRKIAMGISVTLTALGPIIMPLLIVKLLEDYSTSGTLLVVSGIAMNALVGALLLIPFRNRKQISIEKGINDTSVEKTCGNKDEISQSPESLENSPCNESDVVNDKLIDKNIHSVEDGHEHCVINRKYEKKGFFRQFTKNMDLDLLNDKRYLFVIFGMGISLVAETNFNAMIPFVLTELAGLDRPTIGKIMSIQAVADIAGRLCVPLIGQKTGWSPRNLYVLSLIGSTIGRSCLAAWGVHKHVVIAVAIIVGISKGTKAVFQTLIIPDYVPLERLPAASGIMMVCNGILSICIGPIIGLVHDLTVSYVSALHFTSLLSLSCVVLWLIGGLWKPAIFNDCCCCEKENQPC